MDDERVNDTLQATLTGRSTRRQTLKRAAALGLSAPAVGAALRSPGRTAAQDRTKVTAMGVTVDPQRGLELWDIWKQEIETLHPDIEVEFITPVPGLNTEKLLTMVATGDAPDVVQGSALEFAARGLLVDLTPLIERDGILEERPYFDKSVQAVQYAGKFYAMPGGLSTYVFWINLDELEKTGRQYPQDGVLTFNEFTAIAQEMTVLDADGDPVQWGYATDSWFSRMPPLIWARGGDLFEYDGSTGLATRSTFNTQPVIDAIQWNADLINELNVSPPDAGAAEESGVSFYTGKVGFNYGGNWIISDGRQNIAGSFRWAPLRVPVLNQGDQPLEMVPAFTRGSILASAEDREAAWNVLQYISSPEANETYAEYVTDEIIFDTSEFRERFLAGEAPEHLDLIFTVAEEAGQRPFDQYIVPAERVLFGWGRMVTIMTNELAAVYEGRSSAADVASLIEREINAIIEEGRNTGFDPASPPDALAAP
ncbi:MAG: ABC transporter substrate-binding protein [Thermomicrobiales bacterium]